MRKLCYILLIVVVAIGLTQAQDLTSFNLIGSGARAAAMGGAFTGLADDATAISWNPAGLTQLRDMEASVVARFGFGSASRDFPSDFNLNSWDVETQSNFQFNFGSFVVPFDIGGRHLTAGVAYRTIFDFNNYTKQTTDPAGFFGFDEFITEETGSIYAISPAVAVQITDNFSVGATANIMKGSYEFKDEEDAIITDELMVDFSGFSVDIGVLFRASDQFSAGANFSLPHTLTWEFDFGEADMEIPFFFAVGGAFKPSDVVTILVDYRGRSWSSTKFTGPGGDFDAGLENANSIHVGLEYLASSGDSFIPLRIGYNTVPMLFLDANEKSITGHNITGGIGFILDKLILDAAIEYTILDYIDSIIFGDEISLSQNSFRVTLSGVIHLN